MVAKKEYYIDAHIVQMLEIAPRTLLINYCLRLAAMCIQAKTDTKLQEVMPADINKFLSITFEAEVTKLIEEVVEELKARPEVNAKPQDLAAAAQELSTLIAKLKG